jgi:hypothetical protein
VGVVQRIDALNWVPEEGGYWWGNDQDKPHPRSDFELQCSSPIYICPHCLLLLPKDEVEARLCDSSGPTPSGT